MSQPAWRDLAPKTSALGSRPDSIACSLPPPGPLLQARPPLTTLAELSQLFQVAKPFTLPESESGRHGKRSLLMFHNSHHLYLLLESIPSQPRKSCGALNQRGSRILSFAGR